MSNQSLKAATTLSSPPSSQVISHSPLYMFSQEHLTSPQGQMGGGRRRRKQAMQRFSISQHILTFFVMASFLPMLSSLAHGRTVPSQATLSQGAGEEEARVMRSQIGSRPPRCAGRCYSCGHCEAIQVPTNPQVAVGAAKLARAGVFSKTADAYFRGDYGSNYKPMSWKCKCGNSIFNP